MDLYSDRRVTCSLSRLSAQAQQSPIVGDPFLLHDAVAHIKSHCEDRQHYGRSVLIPAVDRFLRSDRRPSPCPKREIYALSACTPMGIADPRDHSLRRSDRAEELG